MANRLFHVPRFVKWVYPNQVWSFDNPKCVYLSFDDGPHPGITERLLDVLKQFNVQATFFVLGEKVEQHPELFERIKRDGHVVGNHGYQHFNCLEVEEEVYWTNYEKGKAFQTENYFRPPYGRINRKLAKRIGKESALAMWSWLSYDYDTACSDETIMKNLKQHVRGGDILVFHENEHTVARFEVLITAAIRILRDKGFEFRPFPSLN